MPARWLVFAVFLCTFFCSCTLLTPGTFSSPAKGIFRGSLASTPPFSAFVRVLGYNIGPPTTTPSVPELSRRRPRRMSSCPWTCARTSPTPSLPPPPLPGTHHHLGGREVDSGSAVDGERGARWRHAAAEEEAARRGGGFGGGGGARWKGEKWRRAVRA